MISIVIINKNDLGIEKTLKNLIKIKKPIKTEIIVVDASNKKLDFIRKEFPQIRWFNFINKTGKKITIPEQRNLGIKKSKGSIIVFIDANCIPEKDWLIELTKPIICDKELIVAGKTLSLNNNSFHNKSFSDNKDYISNFGAANVAIKKEVFLKAGNFDDNFSIGEDVDFSWIAVKQGFKIKNNQKAIIYHDWGNIQEEAKRGYRYGQARVKLYKKHKDKINNLLIYNKDLFSIYSIIFVFYIILLPLLSFIWPYYLLFLLLPIIKNIKKNIFRKMLFDFFWGLGFVKELIVPEHANKNKPK